MVFPFYLIMKSFAIVPVYIVRKYSVHFPEGTIVAGRGNPYTVSKIKQKENDMNKNIVDTVFKAVALGMGVAVIVLNTLGSLSADTAMTLLGIGVTALAIVGLQKS